MDKIILPENQLGPARRASSGIVESQARAFASIPLLRQFLDAIPDIFLVLNQQRQVVFANKALLTLLNEPDDHLLRGLRPGDVLMCIHAVEAAGCGSTEACHTCGVLQSLLDSLNGVRASGEGRVIRQDGSPLELRISATPLRLNSQTFSLITLKDISHEKRRQALERVFFHDILNLSGVLMGCVEMLDSSTSQEEAAAIHNSIDLTARRIVGEIQAQQEIAQAENGELAVRWEVFSTLDLLREVALLYGSHEIAHERHVALMPDSHDVSLISDRRLLLRVLGNMVKNALEACTPGQIVTLACGADEVTAWFEVHNPEAMPPEVEHQVFQRSFSTKGAGRGLGTYSMKLLTERYLGGAVSFTTSAEAGTTFRAVYPLQPDLPEEAR